ncbi:MAG: TadE/TadG family type IV pilus assembly protein, partial [Streptosporangiaceae bacterium]
VGFAFILPALVLLMLVVGEVSGAVGTYQIMDNAAREGARLAVVPGELAATGDIQNRVIAYAGANGVTLAASNITINQAEIVSPGGGACSITNPCITASKVSVKYTYPVNAFLGATFNMGASVEMRNLY